MGATDELKVLLAGPALARDQSLGARLSGDYLLAHADTVECATAVMQCGEIDVVISEQKYVDGTGVEFLQRMRVVQPSTIRILVLDSTCREEIVAAINDAAIYQVISSPWEPEQISLLLKRALESRELARIHRYLSRALKFADAALHRHARPGSAAPPGDVPAGIATPKLKQAVEHLEAHLVRQSLQRHHWNNSRASRELGLSRVGLANKIRRYRLARAAAPHSQEGQEG
jgi:DNA-binding NtrC family response regulator